MSGGDENDNPLSESFLYSTATGFPNVSIAPVPRTQITVPVKLYTRSNLVVWTLELEAVLRVHWADRKLSASSIAKIIGVTRNAIIGKAHRLGLESRKKNAEPGQLIEKRRQQPIHRRREPRPPQLKVIGRRPPPSMAHIKARHISLIDLKEGDCKFPYGDGPFTFCGCKNRDVDTPFCAEHCAIVYAPRVDGPDPSKKKSEGDLAA